MFSPSARSQAERELPLLVFTPVEWAEEVLVDEVALLNDHAHLEKKAALNALLLLHRWPDVLVSDRESTRKWTRTLNQIAAEEVAHLELVLELLDVRGGTFTKSHKNSYAAELREIERAGADPGDLLDRLCVSALIEARSCERFFLLGSVAQSADIRKLFSGLWASEHGHYRSFLELAGLFVDEESLALRWQEMLEMEAQIIQQQSNGHRIHSWLAS